MSEYLLFTEDDILERVDEYALYCHYLQEDQVIIGAHYHSVVRNVPDENPSFGIFERTGKWARKLPYEFLWKDQGAGLYGDIFDLVQKMFKYKTRKEALLKVIRDFGLGGTPDGVLPIIPIAKERIYADPIDISITSKPFSKSDLLYWEKINVREPILDEYFTTSVKQYWLSDDQKTPSYPRGSMYAYRIWDKYQLYSPFAEKKKKFRNNLNEACVMGFLQLKKISDLCIITKSMKDIMCLSSFGYEAVAPRGEHTMLPIEFIQWVKTIYPRILILFDNDGKHNGDNYEFSKIFIPKLVDTDKDTSDFCENHGPYECAQMLQQITANG